MGERTTTTADARLARLFGLRGDTWLRHANPVSAWTRFAVLPLLALAVWSRVWLGWWALVPVALVLLFTAVNPVLFPPPASTRHWTSRGVFGERIWAERGSAALPDRFRRSRVPAVTYAFQVAGLVQLAYGLVVLDVVAVVGGVVLVQCAKAWFIDRMVLLFEEEKTRRPEYAAWEY
ncbi:DUF6653 family protein [Geodermatophilus sp. SYSU D00703]